MSTMNFKITVAVAVVVWMIVCLVIYRAFRHAAWLAASKAASCLFLTGATMAASLFVLESLWLVPLWVGLAVLAAVHLHEASQKSVVGVERRLKIKLEPGAQGSAPQAAGDTSRFI